MLIVIHTSYFEGKMAFFVKTNKIIKAIFVHTK